jgi:Ser/Thr protein kinase RdoA (MazF antagonist)
LDFVGEPTFDLCLEAILDGHRQNAPVPDDHLGMMPTFIVARALSYLGWVHSRSYTDWADSIAEFLIPSAEALARDYLK